MYKQRWNQDLTLLKIAGPDAQIAELTDFISAAELEKELDVQTRELPEEDVEKSHSQLIV